MTPLTETERDAVCAEALTWLNTPYVPGARIKGVGVDCGGLIYEAFNPVLGPFAAYPRYAQDWAAHQDEEKYLDFIKPHVRQVGAPKQGDLSLFHIGLVYAHAALMMPDGRYIHAWGRRRDGRCTITAARTMHHMNKLYGNGNPVRHFEAVRNG